MSGFYLEKSGVKISILSNSLEVQWLRLGTFTAVGPSSIPGGELRSHNQHSTAKEKQSIQFLKDDCGSEMQGSGCVVEIRIAEGKLGRSSFNKHSS